MFLGFEDAFEMLDTFTSKSEYPPYNIERLSADEVKKFCEDQIK